MLRRTWTKISLGTALVLPVPVLAQTPPDNAALARQVEILRNEVEALRAELAASRAASATTATATGPTQIAAAPVAPPAAAPPATAAASASPAVQVAFKGAPEYRTADGWSFKPRGRIQFDAGYLNADRSIDSAVDGTRVAAVLRRAFVGAQGTIPGGFSYRAEIDLAPRTPEWSDLYIAYDRGPLNITVGQIYPFLGIEQMSSDLFPSFTERAAFIGAFNYRRRIGLSAGLTRKRWMVQAGMFGDSIADIVPDGTRSLGFDARAVWMPKVDDTQFHLAASAHTRHYFDYPTPNATRYRSRPYFFSTTVRPIETDTVNIEAERNVGLEFAAIRHRFHAVGEASAFESIRANHISPTYKGAYAEAGLFLTPDTRGYRNGQFDRTIPTHPLGDGIGAIELNVRYDYLDLTDNSSIFAGRQRSIGGSLVWTPLPYVRFIGDIVQNHFLYRGFPPSTDVDTATIRAQVDF
jgi:phosphate-selective porin OprO/OprP